MLGVADQKASRTYEIGALRYEGETDLLDVLTLQQRVFSARSSKVGIERQHLEQYIALNLALGGDWT